jgi:hypothetical protein
MSSDYEPSNKTQIDWTGGANIRFQCRRAHRDWRWALLIRRSYRPAGRPENCSLLHRVDHVEDWQIHGYHHAANHDAKEHDHDRLEQ